MFIQDFLLIVVVEIIVNHTLFRIADNYFILVLCRFVILVVLVIMKNLGPTLSMLYGFGL